MRRLWRLFWIIRQLQDYRVFLRMVLTTHDVELQMRGHNGAVITGDEYTARRYLGVLREEERRSLEWAECSRRSGRTAGSKRG